MTKVKDVETAESSKEPGWAANLRFGGYFKTPAGGAAGSHSSDSKSSSGKNKGVGSTTDEELKLLGSPSSPPNSSSGIRPTIMSASASPSGKDYHRGGKDDDLLDHSNNATLTINGLSGLDDHDHTTTYTGTINSLSRIKNRFSSKYGRMRKRVIFKNGDLNLHQTNISKRRRKYLADLFITLVDLQWRWTFLLFAMSFLSSWTCFAAVYWLISYTHGDLEVEHLNEEAGWNACIANLHSFTSAFLFSIETQTTIGYGSRYTTEECPEAIFMMCIQSILGTIIQAFMVGVVFTKMSRPKKRKETLAFSRHAVINQRDGSLTLQIRVGDLRDQSNIICASIRAQLIKRSETPEGEVLPFYQHELKVGVDSDQQAVFFIWPMIVIHKIDSESPLYNVAAEELIKEKFEIVVILEGVIESTGATTQARSSYLPSEILWGHRFEPLVSFRKELGEYAVDYSLFNNTYEVDTPRCSAAALTEMQNTEADLTRKGLRILTPFHVSTVEERSSGKSANAGHKAKAAISDTGGGSTSVTSPGGSSALQSASKQLEGKSALFLHT